MLQMRNSFNTPDPCVTYSVNWGFLVNHNSARSRLLKLVFRLKGFILIPPLKRISRFPISIKRPHEAMQLQLSWSKSPESELRITSIPRLFVIFLICHPKEVSRDEKMWSSAIPCSSIKNWRFSELLQVAKIFHFEIQVTLVHDWKFWI